MNFIAVVTTIQAPTAAIIALHRRLTACGGRLIVAGDKKGPPVFDLPDCDCMSLNEQQARGYALAEKLPVGHYARKDIGYLEAMRQGAACIYETDDDNAPLAHWKPRDEYPSEVSVIGGEQSYDTKQNCRWVNVYRYFTDELIWPRGFPLNEIHTTVPEANHPMSTSQHLSSSACPLRAPIQQGLVNGSPDVDAVWRLTQDRPFEFNQSPSLWLAPGQWCPFNTQSTWWWPVAYPLLYIPSHCSFRMCDIWKSFVAQRCLWAMGMGVVFHAPEVFQVRNAHDLLRDFADEIPGYLHNAHIADVLSPLALDDGAASVGRNLRACYEALVRKDLIPAAELSLVDAWLDDLRRVAEVSP